MSHSNRNLIDANLEEMLKDAEIEIREITSNLNSNTETKPNLSPNTVVEISNVRTQILDRNIAELKRIRKNVGTR
jgi:hypothetical protein